MELINIQALYAKGQTTREFKDKDVLLIARPNSQKGDEHSVLVINKTDFVSSLVAPYKKYVALISQSGLNAEPSSNVLENTFGDTNVDWTYISAGVYKGSLTGAFKTGKTFILKSPLPGNTFQDLSGNIFTALVSHSIIDEDSFYLITFENGAPPSDSWLNDYPIEIRVYD